MNNTRKTLLVTAAAAALLAGAGLASAQGTNENHGAPGAAANDQKAPRGKMDHQPGSVSQKSPTPTALVPMKEKQPASTVQAPAKEKLAPTAPPHPYGVKRLSLEQRYFEVYNQKNVLLVDLRETPIERITAEGVLTSDGLEHKLDVLILATGFDMVSGGLTAINIKGTSGLTLRDKWKSGISAYLGSATHGFPNMLFLYGPQAPAGLSNGPSSAELQGDEIVELLKFMKGNGRSRLESSDQADKAWRERIDQYVETTLFRTG